MTNHLTTKFSRKASILRSEQALSDDQMRAVAPSVFAESKHSSRSDKYEFIPTSQVLAGLRKEGFQPFMVAQGASRIEGKAEFTKHMLRLRHEGQGKVQGQANEIILINSHDGVSSYQLLAGVFRFVCCNGMVCGDVSHDIRIPHKGQIQDDVINGACRIIQDFERVDGVIDAMRQTVLDTVEQYELSRSMLALRYGTNEQGEVKAPVSPFAPLTRQRLEDLGSDLWTTFNVLQENLVRGGLPGRSSNNRRVTTRPIVGIDSNLALNRGLWELAEAMLRQKRGL
jgi:hypothetical protein